MHIRNVHQIRICHWSNDVTCKASPSNA